MQGLPTTAPRTRTPTLESQRASVHHPSSGRIPRPESTRSLQNSLVDKAIAEAARQYDDGAQSMDVYAHVSRRPKARLQGIFAIVTRGPHEEVPEKSSLAFNFVGLIAAIQGAMHFCSEGPFEH